MQITIDYCVTCNYRPIAAVLALTIQQAFGVKAVLVPSNRSGAFEVSVDGEVIFSKLRSGLFPSNREILEALNRHVSA